VTRALKDPQWSWLHERTCKCIENMMLCCEQLIHPQEKPPSEPTNELQTLARNDAAEYALGRCKPSPCHENCSSMQGQYFHICKHCTGHKGVVASSCAASRGMGSVIRTSKPKRW
jgi:hypothetical protein